MAMCARAFWRHFYKDIEQQLQRQKPSLVKNSPSLVPAKVVVIATRNGRRLATLPISRLSWLRFLVDGGKAPALRGVTHGPRAVRHRINPPSWRRAHNRKAQITVDHEDLGQSFEISWLKGSLRHANNGRETTVH